MKKERIKITTYKSNTKQRYHKKRILAYSAKKIKANPPPPYLTLNPETNFDIKQSLY